MTPTVLTRRTPGVLFNLRASAGNAIGVRATEIASGNFNGASLH